MPKNAVPNTFFSIQEITAESFERLNQLADGNIGRDGNINMNMVASYCSPDYFHMVFFAEPTDQLSDFEGNIAYHHWISILSYPNNMIGAIKLGMAGFSEILHIPPYYHLTVGASS